MSPKNVIVTGSEGFLGRNLISRLREIVDLEVLGITLDTPPSDLISAISKADLVFHMAGVNRPKDESDFHIGNVMFTEFLCNQLASTGRPIPIVFSSSIQATLDNPYGKSKLAAEKTLSNYTLQTGSSVSIFRLTNVFGKWSRPNYNSVVATFCHNLARGLPIQVNNPLSKLRLVYVDDVMDAFLDIMFGPNKGYRQISISPVYDITIGELAGILNDFIESRQCLVTPKVGSGLIRALYSTYMSYIPPDHFGYFVPVHEDPRGEFTEMLRTAECGQFSYLTARPGITRGEHYHHSKTEKFLVIRGKARFQFRHITTGETHELVALGGAGQIVETVPGWAHNITNIGTEELIVLLWANEIFNPSKPDTFPMKVVP